MTTKWLKYDAKQGIVGDEIPGPASPSVESQIAFFFPDNLVTGVTALDNFDGTTTVTVSGSYLSGTRVHVGSSYLDESTPGFQNSIGTYIRFTAADQMLALNGASLVTRDGVETQIFADSGTSTALPACGPAQPPQSDVQPASPASQQVGQGDFKRISTKADQNKAPDGSAQPSPSESKPGVALKQFSDTVVEVTVPLKGFQTDKPSGPNPIVVSMGGKAFGLGDAPFKSASSSEVTFLAPKDLVRTSRRLTIKRLFLQSPVETYDVPAISDFMVSGLSVVSSNKNETTYALSGIALSGSTILPEPKSALEFADNGTMAFFSLSANQVDGLKQLIVKHGTDSPVLVSLPDSKPTATKPQLTAHDPISPGTGVTYTITGTMLDSVASIQYLGKQLPYSLSLDKKSIAIKLPDEMTSSVGIRSLLVTYSDGSTDRYSVTVGKPK